jgi:hypothetical protein
MNWSAERDALIAQTLAFVQSVTGKTPAAAAPAEPVSVGATLAGPASIGHASNLSARLDNTTTSSAEAGPTRELPPTVVSPQSEIRKEVQNRIAAFQAHQHRFHREREAYFNSVLTRVRSTHETRGETPPT